MCGCVAFDNYRVQGHMIFPQIYGNYPIGSPIVCGFIKCNVCKLLNPVLCFLLVTLISISQDLAIKTTVRGDNQHFMVTK